MTNEKPTGCDLCGDQPDQNEMYLYQMCHLTAPLEVCLMNDVLIVRCYVPDCRREVARFKIEHPMKTAN